MPSCAAVCEDYSLRLKIHQDRRDHWAGQVSGKKPKGDRASRFDLIPLDAPTLIRPRVAHKGLLNLSLAIVVSDRDVPSMVRHSYLVEPICQGMKADFQR